MIISSYGSFKAGRGASHLDIMVILPFEAKSDMSVYTLSAAFWQKSVVADFYRLAGTGICRLDDDTIGQVFVTVSFEHHSLISASSC